MNNGNSRELVIFGAGGQAVVALQVARAIGQWRDIVFVDKFSTKDIRGYPVVSENDIQLKGHEDIHFAIGSNVVRHNLAVRFSETRHKFPALISPNAYVSNDVVIGGGSLVMPGVCINTGAYVGKHCIVNTGAVIEHDCQIGDFVSLGPRATLCGAVQLDQLSMVGAGATVLQTLTIGQAARVGAGALVLDNIPTGITVVGVPAREYNYKS